MIAGFYTYIHMRADDGRVFYVGKGRGSRAHSQKGRNQRWMRTAAKHGLRVEVAAHWPSESEAFEHERFLIQCFRGMGAPLCNMTDGGDGISGFRHKAETRARWSQVRTGRKTSDETKAKMSSAAKARGPHPNSLKSLFGRPVSDETRQKISAAQKGRTVSPEMRERLAAALRGRKQPEHVREKVAAMTRTPEWRARHSAAMKGRPWSEARRAAQKAKE